MREYINTAKLCKFVWNTFSADLKVQFETSLLRSFMTVSVFYYPVCIETRDQIILFVVTWSLDCSGASSVTTQCEFEMFARFLQMYQVHGKKSHGCRA